MPDLTEAQRERLAEALGWPVPVGGFSSVLSPLERVVAAIADEAAAEALDQRNEALDRLSDRTRAKWEAEARYAALVDKVRALADKWGGYGHGRYNVHLEERLPCPACDLLAELRELLEADQ